MLTRDLFCRFEGIQSETIRVPCSTGPQKTHRQVGLKNGFVIFVDVCRTYCAVKVKMK